MIGERRCQRCGDEEFRIDGYCTEYCKDLHAVERERDEALAEVERLRRGIEAYRNLVQVHRIESHGIAMHQVFTNNNHASAVWSWEIDT